MKYLLPLLFLPLAGCGSITRAEYESANAQYQTQLVEIPLENGDVRVCYGGLNPQIALQTGGNVYSCPSGMRVVTYRDGVIVARWWQNDEPLAERKP